MATANNKKQKLIIQDILSSPEIYTRCAAILKPSYFEKEYEPLVAFIHEYYEKYNNTPSVDQIEAEFDIELKETTKVSRDRVESTCDNIEKFCREVAVKKAVLDSLVDIEENKLSSVVSRINDAVNISLQKDLGMEFFNEDAEAILTGLIEEFQTIPTGIEGIDGPLDGGLIRKQLTMFSANSGGGKSLMLANIGANYAKQGLDVVCITLELAEPMVFLRLASIVTGYDTTTWKSNIPQIASSIIKSKKEGAGSYLLKRMPQHSTAADIRAFLTYYEMEFGKTPDVLLVDYLDLMDPNIGIKNISVFEQDKRKTEELVEILHNYDMIGVTASQQNRQALSMSSPDQSIIAGGISKINTVDNYISLYMSDEMRLEGEMNAYFLKTRSSRGVGKFSLLGFNPNNLQIGDPSDGAQTSVMPKRKSKHIEEALEEIQNESIDVTADVKDMPGIEPPVKETKKLDQMFEEPETDKPKKQPDQSVDKLLELMTSFS
jgi:hypothetical protein